ncbi:MAG: stage V sporulation protein AB [Lachnospiraceae bacterium]|nr:stage V sporulation protein AB [Lachnospiraceae bacterium]
MNIGVWLAGFTGLAAGSVIAGGLVALFIALRIIPRYAGITRTAQHVMLYENCAAAGAVVGNLVTIFNLKLPMGYVGTGIFGLFAGIYLGGWLIALTEIVDIFPILLRRMGMVGGRGWIVLSIAVGKILGALLFFWQRW